MVTIAVLYLYFATMLRQMADSAEKSQGSSLALGSVLALLTLS